MTKSYRTYETANSMGMNISVKNVKDVQDVQNVGVERGEHWGVSLICREYRPAHMRGLEFIEYTTVTIENIIICPREYRKTNFPYTIPKRSTIPQRVEKTRDAKVRFHPISDLRISITFASSGHRAWRGFWCHAYGRSSILLCRIITR